jgi:hypothetical protein
MPDDLCLGARGFLAIGAPSAASFFGGMVVEGKRRSCNCGGRMAASPNFGGQNASMRRNLEGKRN